MRMPKEFQEKNRVTLQTIDGQRKSIPTTMAGDTIHRVPGFFYILTTEASEAWNNGEPFDHVLAKCEGYYDSRGLAGIAYRMRV